MKNPQELPDTPVDFRRFAKDLTSAEGWADDLRYAMDEEVETRAIVFGGKTLPGSAQTSAKSDMGPVLEMGIRAAEEAAADPETPLSPDRNAALEAVVRLRERPALLIRKNDFPEPPDRWRHLNESRQFVRAQIPCAGRINWRADEMAGTGFVVGEDIVMTNRHVVELFADPPPMAAGTWKFWSGANPTINLRMEYGEPERMVFAIKSVVGVHPVQDLALLHVAKEASEPVGAALPSPVKLAGPETNRRGRPADYGPPGTDLYTIGYPYLDNENVTPPEVIRAIYNDIFQVKRLQPGQFNSMFPEYGVFSHDCSTLGGNSGSGIVDLASNRIIGVHYKGKYRQANYAVAIWLLKGDNLFAGRSLNFQAKA